jgi:hypothetical protein
MKKLGQFTFLILVLLFFTIATGKALNVPNQISSAFSSGNSKELAKFFNSSIELVILDKENIYSNEQAEQILSNFFSKHRPTGFKVIHEGGKEGAKYAIGILKTAGQDFRVYFLLKSGVNKSYIHQLRIEKENGN